MRSGCVVIAVNVSSIPEVAGDAAILLDDPHPAAIAHALKNLKTSCSITNYAIMVSLKQRNFRGKNAIKIPWQYTRSA